MPTIATTEHDSASPFLRLEPETTAQAEKTSEIKWPEMASAGLNLTVAQTDREIDGSSPFLGTTLLSRHARKLLKNHKKSGKFAGEYPLVSTRIHAFCGYKCGYSGQTH